MPSTPPGITLGLGAAAALGWPTNEDRSGTVIASFHRAAYVRFAGGLVALTAAGVPPGPIHMSVPVEPASMVPGKPVVIPGAWLARASRWKGRLPAQPPADGVVLEALKALAAGSPLLQPPLRSRWDAASSRPDLAAAGRILAGLGPGLTPSGDDALAGMLLAERLRNPDAEDRLVVLAAGIDTHEISLAFLHWAARGQSIEPVHRLLQGQPSAVADLGRHGQSSGADLALGLCWALTGRDLVAGPTADQAWWSSSPSG